MSKRFIYYGSFASVVIDYFTNLFGVPDAAYSLRKLSPNSVYSGAAIRVRRSSDNAEQDIDFVNSDPDAGIDTSALLSFVGSGGGFVTTWYNQNGSSSHLTQTTAGNQPKVVDNGSLITNGGLPSVLFATTAPFSQLLNNDIGGRANLTSFRVHDVSKSQYLTFSGSQADYNYVATINSTNTIIFQSYGSPQLFINGIAPSPLTNRGHVYTAQNGRKIISEFGNTSQWNVFRIGGYGGGWDFAGHLPELIFYYSDQLSQRTAIETNINNYYNVF